MCDFFFAINLKNISASLDKNKLYKLLPNSRIFFCSLAKNFFIHIFLSIWMKKYCDDKYEMYIRKIITQNAKRNPFTNANFAFEILVMILDLFSWLAKEKIFLFNSEKCWFYQKIFFWKVWYGNLQCGIYFR